MAYYKLKANLDGFEIEFNTKERHLVEAQMNDYLAIFTGNKPMPRQYEPQKRQVEPVNYEQKFMEQRAQATATKVENQQYVPQSENVYRAQPQVQQQTQYIQQQAQYAQYQAQTQQHHEDAKPQVNEEKIREKISFNFEAKEEQPQKTFNEIYSEQQGVNNQHTSEFRYAQNINQNNFAYDNVQNQAIQNYNSEPTQRPQENPYQNQGLDLYQPKREPDLPEFMHNKISNGIFDDFIITAYFIKNVLNIKNFSVKFLNSKLYAAKEKLVDYAILNEAISRNYIRFIEGSQETGTKEYAITEAGESYYLSLDNG
ncbi:hypothetical protein IKA15_05230 [bacterium]|nr:hypothetical protein [bacterium]